MATNPFQVAKNTVNWGVRAQPATPLRRVAPQAMPRPPVSQSLSQVANQRVNQQLAPQVAAQDAFASRQNQAIQQFAQAMLGKLQPIAGQVGADYDKAIQQQGALSGQAAQFLQNANPSGKVAELLGGSRPDLDPQFQQTFGGGAGVLAFLGGTVPGSEMAAAKAASQGEAAQLPGLAALQGQQDLASALWQQGQDRRTLEATRPALYQQAAQDIRTNNNARASIAARQASTAVSASSLKQKTRQFDVTTRQKADQFDRTAKATAANRSQQAQVAQSKLLLAKYATDLASGDRRAAASSLKDYRASQAQIAEYNANTARTNAETSRARAATAAAASAARLAQGDKRLRIAQSHEAAYEKSQAAKIAKAKAAKKGISATTYAGLRKQALKAADTFYYGKVVKKNGVIDDDLSISGVTYQKAISQLVDGYSLTRMDAAAILNDFYAPGERGRPGNKTWGRPVAGARGR